MTGHKARSQYKKKRRGFAGIQKQIIAQQRQIPQPLPPPTLPTSSSTPRPSPKKANRSFEKISRNCPLRETETTKIMTRKRAFSDLEISTGLSSSSTTKKTLLCQQDN